MARRARQSVKAIFDATGLPRLSHDQPCRTTNTICQTHFFVAHRPSRCSTLICVPACSKILFTRFGTSPGIATRRCNAKNSQACQNLQILGQRLHPTKVIRTLQSRIMGLTANHSHTSGLPGISPDPVRQLWAKFRVHLICERACCTISTKTFRVSP